MARTKKNSIVTEKLIQGQKLKNLFEHQTNLNVTTKKALVEEKSRLLNEISIFKRFLHFYRTWTSHSN